MKEILELIEGVDPSDTAKLDEIDFAVLQYIAFGKFEKNAVKGVTLTSTGNVSLRVSQYTRSRDALKAIRPKSVSLTLYEINNGGGFVLGVRCVLDFVDGKKVFSPDKLLPTEELAELHAIIQAIEYERNTTINKLEKE